MQRILNFVLLAAVVVLVPIVPFIVIGELPGERWLSAKDDSALTFALAGSGLLMLDVVLPIPSSIVAALMGGRLGFYAGWFSAWLGLTAGNLLGYWIGLLWPQRKAPQIPESPALILLILSRPVPIIAEAMTIAAGATRMSQSHMMGACAAGNAVYTGILAAYGATLLAADWTGPGIFLALLVPAAGSLIWHRLRGGIAKESAA